MTSMICETSHVRKVCRVIRHIFGGAERSFLGRNRAWTPECSCLRLYLRLCFRFVLFSFGLVLVLLGFMFLRSFGSGFSSFVLFCFSFLPFFSVFRFFRSFLCFCFSFCIFVSYKCKVGVGGGKVRRYPLPLREKNLRQVKS